MDIFQIHLEERRIDAGELTLAARLEGPGSSVQRLWWRLPAEWADAVTTWADPFVVGFLFPAMQIGGDLFVEGRVSPWLLAKLETFMAIWHAWAPQRYRPVRIRAAEEVEPPPPSEPDQAIVPCSCGLDSSFTLLRHHRGMMGRRNCRLGAGLVLHGFDIPFERKDADKLYDELLSDARDILGSIGLPCIPLSGNFRELGLDRHDTHGLHLISGLHLLSRRFGVALIPNSTPYTALSVRWGSHPLSDPLLSSRHFRVVDDGAEIERVAKVAAISHWPAAMERFRVCASNVASQRNCCRCEKCIRSALAFLTAGCPVPPTLSAELAPAEIRGIRFSRNSPLQLHFWQEIIHESRQRGLARTKWAQAVRIAVRRNHLNWFLRKLKRPLVPVRNVFRTIFRGSPLSRAELATQCRANARQIASGREE